MPPHPIEPDDVRQRLRFAATRLHAIHQLNGGNFPGAPADDKHQLVQEFFFHLGGAVELAAQMVNHCCALQLDPDTVSVAKVLEKMPRATPIYAKLSALYAAPRRPCPPDPYSDDGMVWRAYNYRHQVTHRGRNPFLYRSNTGFGASFLLDPRLGVPDASRLTVHEDMRRMLEVFSTRFEALLAALPETSAGAA